MRLTEYLIFVHIDKGSSVGTTFPHFLDTDNVRIQPNFDLGIENCTDPVANKRPPETAA
jgi:hypothetical protein